MMLLLSRSQIESFLTMPDVISSVEEGFKEYALGRVLMPVRSILACDRYNGQMLTMPAYISGNVNAMGQKVVSVYPNNPAAGLPTIQATIQLLDPKTGSALAIMDGTFLTAMRTGAVSAVATKYLARKDSKIATIIGAGVQAATQLSGLCNVRTIERANVYDIDHKRAIEFSKRMSKILDTKVEAAEKIETTVRDSDIISCATTSKTPVLKGEWLAEGTHINGVGSFVASTREVDTSAVLRSKVVVDSREAAMEEAGDLIIPIKEKAITPSHIWAELGEVIIGKKPGRESETEITFFKSVGLSLQDISTANLVYKRAIEHGIGTKIDL